MWDWADYEKRVEGFKVKKARYHEITVSNLAKMVEETFKFKWSGWNVSRYTVLKDLDGEFAMPFSALQKRLKAGNTTYPSLLIKYFIKSGYLPEGNYIITNEEIV